MISKLIAIAGLLMMGAGYLLLDTRFSGGDGLAALLALMGGGALLLLLPLYRVALAAGAVPGLLAGDKKLSRDMAEIRLRYISMAAVIVGLVGLQLSPYGFNSWSIGFSLFVLAAGAAYLAGRAALEGPAGLSNVVKVLAGLAAFCGGMVSVITLILQLSGASDMPQPWNIYSYMGLAGLAASLYAAYYALTYQTDADLLFMLAPHGFTMADSGPLGRDGKYDARGSWDGVEMLVNMTQFPPHKSSPPSFSLQVRCELKNWSGRRLLVHPGGFLNRPLGVPLGLPKAEKTRGWEKYSVYCEPPEAALSLLGAIGAKDGPVLGTGSDFSFLLMDGGRLELAMERTGRPAPRYVKRVMTLAAGAAKALS
jgi:hypothetical protein